ncbi:type ISP restriction/modification enzyme [Flexithrix dorotheae]|uniref:type ISP restriction/modification enzyme n=1 Tax=Flexithrix dorotheae TaxID=70993 RepID=UPI00037D8016|nr:type ISP restriction/modification enzyme [Flexithrix dorotheae]
MSRKIVKYFASKIQENPDNFSTTLKGLISVLAAYHSVVFIEDSKNKSQGYLFQKTGFQIGSFSINTDTNAEHQFENSDVNQLIFSLDRFCLFQKNEAILSGSYAEKFLFFKALKYFFNFESEQFIEAKAQKTNIVRHLEQFKSELLLEIEKKAKSERVFRNKRNELVNRLRNLLHPKITPVFVHNLLIQHLILSNFIDQLNLPKQRLEKDFIFRDFQEVWKDQEVEVQRKYTLWENLKSYFNEVAKSLNRIEDKILKGKFLRDFINEFYGVFFLEKSQKRQEEIPNEILEFCAKALDNLIIKEIHTQFLNLSPDLINEKKLLGNKAKFSRFQSSLAPYYIHLLTNENPTEFLNPLSMSGSSDNSLQTNLFGGNGEVFNSVSLGKNKFDFIAFSGNSLSLPENEFLHFEYFQKDKKGVDDKIKDTYYFHSQEPSNSLFDSGLKFIRWATDQLTDKGLILALLPSKYFTEKKYDGFRISLEKEFAKINLIDLGKIEFQDNSAPASVWTNTTLCFLQKSPKNTKKALIEYYQLPSCDSFFEKQTLVKSLIFEQIDFQTVKPQNGNWFSQKFFDFLPLIAEAAAPGKCIFKTYSKGIFPQDSQYLIKFHQDDLEKKYKLFQIQQNGEQKDFAVRTGYYKPFVKREMVYSKDLGKELQEFPSIFPIEKDDFANQLICTSGPGSQNPFQVLATDAITTFDFLEKTICFPQFLWRNPEKTEENITDWCLKQFKEFYIPIITTQIKEAKNKSVFLQEMTEKISVFSKNLPVLHKFTLKIAAILKANKNDLIDPEMAREIVDIILSFEKKLLILGKDAKERKKMITTLKNYLSETKTELLNIGKKIEELKQKQTWLTKQNIFYYIYGILLDPDFQGEFQEELKNNFPRIPLKQDFWRYSSNGKKLMDLHLNYSEIPGFPISKNEEISTQDVSEKPVLKVNKNLGSILVDSHLELGNIPPKAWEFKLGNYSVLEILVRNYKKKGIRKNTNWKPLYHYDFSLLKAQLINDVSRLSALSIETQKILNNQK